MQSNHQQLDLAFTDFWLRMEFGPHKISPARLDFEDIAMDYYIAFSFAFDKADRSKLDELLRQKKPLPEEFLPLLTLLMDGLKRRGGPIPKFTTAERRNIFFLMMQDQLQTGKKIEELTEDFSEKIELNTEHKFSTKSFKNILREFKKEWADIELRANNHNST